MNPAGWAGLMVSMWITRHRNGGMIRLAVPGFIIVDTAVIVLRVPLGKCRAVLNREGKAFRANLLAQGHAPPDARRFALSFCATVAVRVAAEGLAR
jgi:hypothetical protein